MTNWWVQTAFRVLNCSKSENSSPIRHLVIKPKMWWKYFCEVIKNLHIYIYRHITLVSSQFWMFYDIEVWREIKSYIWWSHLDQRWDNKLKNTSRCSRVHFSRHAIDDADDLCASSESYHACDLSWDRSPTSCHALPKQVIQKKTLLNHLCNLALKVISLLVL